MLAVTAPNGAPHAVPTWYEYQDGTIVFHSDPRAYKYKCLQHDPLVTLVVDTKQPPFYKCVIVKGRATIELKNDDARFRKMAIAYMGKEDGERYGRLDGRWNGRGRESKARSRHFVGLRTRISIEMASEWQIRVPVGRTPFRRTCSEYNERIRGTLRALVLPTRAQADF